MYKHLKKNNWNYVSSGIYTIPSVENVHGISAVTRMRQCTSIFRIHVLTIQVQLGGKYSKDYLDLTYIQFLYSALFTN